jgi:ribonucleotide monophosphatase NagD (HAD superfamily)
MHPPPVAHPPLSPSSPPTFSTPRPHGRFPQALQTFRAQGKRLLFVTNNASKSRVTYVEKFRSLGLDVKPTEVQE